MPRPPVHDTVRRSSLVAGAAAVLLVVAACETTPPPANGDPTPDPTVVTPMTTLAGVAQGYGGGTASFAVHVPDDEGGWAAGSTSGVISAAGAFSVGLVGPPNAVLSMTSPDELAERYGDCLSLSRAIRTGGGSARAFTGALPNPTLVAAVDVYDAADPAALLALTFVRPVGGASAVMTIRLPLSVVVVHDPDTDTTTRDVTCGDEVHAFELQEGWYLNANRVAMSDHQLPNGHLVSFDVYTGFSFLGALPAEATFVAVP